MYSLENLQKFHGKAKMFLDVFVDCTKARNLD